LLDLNRQVGKRSHYGDSAKELPEIAKKLSRIHKIHDFLPQ